MEIKEYSQLPRFLELDRKWLETMNIILVNILLKKLVYRALKKMKPEK